VARAGMGDQSAGTAEAIGDAVPTFMDHWDATDYNGVRPTAHAGPTEAGAKQFVQTVSGRLMREPEFLKESRAQCQ
jgi:hypothetical protein